ncbi:hypothetical protein [Vibrio breoganii]|uniref:Transporter n=1 Tax=Vibrio breoganii TaxID=553239 RepID=A0ABX1UE19_9VIBR|nr:hypothetical protein [Vibrio breoganii]NMO75142.1 hypothetical protein [Vibrio breoganii]NMR71644.1 hypothetical protein [Vibrio breoganii]PMG02872.1 hypothetical protein BCV02_10215 [Vibrio breoganii]PMG96739.1 hypothetical protein BCU79_06465 [Vibrio breoganii]PML90370.1 hypothetical protein BCT67_05970 [Vibrio breoganii]
MKKILIASIIGLATFSSMADQYGAPELTANQPGVNAASNAAVYAGKGLLGAFTYGNYSIKGVDTNGTDVPTDLSLEVLLGTLHYNTDWDLFGGKYSFGATLVSGGLYPGSSEHDMNGKLLSVSQSPWLTPVKINWQLGEDWHVAANYTLRFGLKSGNTNTDKTYDVHQLGAQTTWNINQEWQANFASNIEYRTKDLRPGKDMKPGTIGYFESSLQRRFDNGMNLGGYAYHVRHLSNDKGTNDAGEILGRSRSELTGVGVEWAMPLKAIGAGLNVRIFTEPYRRNHMHGVRAFVSVAKKF